MMTFLLMVAILACLLAMGFFSGTETALTSVDPLFIHAQEQRGDRNAPRVRQLLSRMEMVLVTTLVGTNLMHVSSATLAELLLHRHVPGQWEALVNTLLMTPIILVFCEMVPKATGRTHANRLSLLVARPLRAVELAFLPIVALVNVLSTGAARLFGGPRRRRGAVTRDDLQVITDMAAEEGTLPEGAVGMVQTVFELRDRPVSSVMIPLMQMAAVREEAMVEDALRLSAVTGFSRFPVYRGHIREVVGILDVRAVLYRLPAENLRQSSAPPRAPVRNFMQADFARVPEHRPVGELLHELHFHKTPMAAVINRGGAVIGFVTTEDLIEEVVGDIRDERETDAHTAADAAAR
ncbi:MAG: Magnesium and cobalt efflux protein CorC [Lentisphaerae bacterium ADurb.BinA184]|nr:MAG: Magnesium and cobalt efflux protein CorC [Lentisphaerae bacterium ADurb.BinA184]